MYCSHGSNSKNSQRETYFYRTPLVAASEFKELNIRLYRLPREETLKTVWKQKLKRKKLPVDKNIRVCNLRFE